MRHAFGFIQPPFKPAPAEARAASSLCSAVLPNVRGGFLATQHLIERGYDSVGFIGAAEDSWTVDDRLKGYRRAMKKHEMAVDDDFIRFGDYRQTSGYATIREMIGTGRYPRAVFAENDLIALGIIQGVRESGLRVPGDIAVIGFDDIPFAAFPEVQLSTVLQPKYQMGRKAVEIILEEMQAMGGKADGGGKQKRILLDPELVVRRST